MTERLEWDWPPTRRYHRRPRIEIIQPSRTRVVVTRRRRSALDIAAFIIAVWALVRFAPAIVIAFFVLATLLGW
jgi:hypothetical protein